MATRNQLEIAEQHLFKDSVNEAVDVLNNIGMNIKAREIYVGMKANMLFFFVVRSDDNTEEAVKVKELAVLKLGETYAKHKMEQGK